MAIERMTFNETLNQIARDIPNGYFLEISVEKDSGWISVYDADGQSITQDMDLDDLDLESQISVILEYLNELKE